MIETRGIKAIISGSLTVLEALEREFINRFRGFHSHFNIFENLLWTTKLLLFRRWLLLENLGTFGPKMTGTGGHRRCYQNFKYLHMGKG